MTTQAENELMTQVEGDAPMGVMMKEWFWIPALRAGRLKPGGDPVRVRLFGDNYIAFRAADGRVGFFDEYCPHRRCSLALAKVEDNALRCIFHGWKFDVSGTCVEVPTVSKHADEFAAKVAVAHFPVRELGGLIWVWLGRGEPRPLPDFGFTKASGANLQVACTTIPVNWMQAVEATIDSSHIGFLHRDFFANLGDKFKAAGDNFAPYYEIEETPYGLRGAALRQLPGDKLHVRITEYVMPFFSAAYTANDSQEIYQILVPRDNESTYWFVTKCNLDGAPLEPETVLAAPGADLDNWVPVQGGPDEYWGQDRQAMAEGRSFSGFARGGLLAEDTIVQISMGPIVDRTKENLSPSDLYIIRTRRLLMQAALDHQAGRAPLGTRDDISYANIRGAGEEIPAGGDWRQVKPPLVG
jgi:nitrite reductase/ring-hydroxylating ferredoxin subunit